MLLKDTLIAVAPLKEFLSGTGGGGTGLDAVVKSKVLEKELIPKELDASTCQ